MEHKRSILSHLFVYVSAIPFRFAGGVPMPFMMLAYVICLFGKVIAKGYIHQIVKTSGGTYEEFLG